MMSKVALLIIYNDIQNFKKITLGNSLFLCYIFTVRISQWGEIFPEVIV